MILSIILAILNLILIIPFIIVNRESKFLQNSFHSTIYYYKNKLGFIVSINGDIRMGKTSLLSGLSSVAQISIIQDLQELLEDTKKILYKFSFNEIDDILIDYYLSFTYKDKENYPDFDYIVDLLIDHLEIESKTNIYNFIGNIGSRKLLIDYAQALFVLNIRNNYVQSKTPFYSHITGTYNLELNLDWLKIKEAYKNKDYAILDWVVILIDEITDEASASEWQSDVKDISGAKEYRRKFGQIHQERNRIISTKQDILDEIKKYRNLTHSHIQIDEKVSTTGNYNFIYNFVEKWFKLQLFFNKQYQKVKYLFIRKKFNKISFNDYYYWYLNEYNITRRKSNYLYYLKQFLKSIGYNRYYGRILKRAEDIEKVTADVEEFYFFIPTIYCFGTYDTHLYKSMQTDLINISNSITKEIIPELNPKFFEEEIGNNEVKGVDDFEF